MTSIARIEGETSEQRQARMVQAGIEYERMKAAMRAEEAAQEEAARGVPLPNPFAVTPEVEVRGVRPTYEQYVAPPMPLYVDPEPPMPVPSATDYIANMIGNGAPPVALPGGSGYDERGNMLKKPSRPTLGDMLRGSMPPQMQPKPTMPSTAPGLIAPPMQPLMDTQPTINREFNMLRERYGDEGLQSAMREYYRGGPVMRYR